MDTNACSSPPHSQQEGMSLLTLFVTHYYGYVLVKFLLVDEKHQDWVSGAGAFENWNFLKPHGF
jgi:hypothetical protein